MNAQAAQILLGALAQVPGAARDLDGWDHDGTRRLESGATEWAFEHECGQAIDADRPRQRGRMGVVPSGRAAARWLVPAVQPCPSGSGATRTA